MELELVRVTTCSNFMFLWTTLSRREASKL